MTWSSVSPQEASAVAPPTTMRPYQGRKIVFDLRACYPASSRTCNALLTSRALLPRSNVGAAVGCNPPNFAWSLLADGSGSDDEEESTALVGKRFVMASPRFAPHSPERAQLPLRAGKKSPLAKRCRLRLRRKLPSPPPRAVPREPRCTAAATTAATAAAAAAATATSKDRKRCSMEGHGPPNFGWVGENDTATPGGSCAVSMEAQQDHEITERMAARASDRAEKHHGYARAGNSTAMAASLDDNEPPPAVHEGRRHWPQQQSSVMNVVTGQDTQCQVALPAPPAGPALPTPIAAGAASALTECPASPPAALSVRVPIAGVPSAEKQDRGKQHQQAQPQSQLQPPPPPSRQQQQHHRYQMESLEQKQAQLKQRQLELEQKRIQLEIEQNLRLQELEQKRQQLELERKQQQQQLEMERRQQQLEMERRQQQLEMERRQQQMKIECRQRQQGRLEKQQDEQQEQRRQQQEQQLQLQQQQEVQQQREQQQEQHQQEQEQEQQEQQQHLELQERQQQDEARLLQQQDQACQQHEQREEREPNEDEKGKEKQQRPIASDSGSLAAQSTRFWVGVDLEALPQDDSAEGKISEEQRSEEEAEDTGFWIDLSRSQQEDDSAAATAHVRQHPRDTGLFIAIPNSNPASPEEKEGGGLDTTIVDEGRPGQQTTDERPSERASFTEWLAQARKGAARTRSRQFQHAAELQALDHAATAEQDCGTLPKLEATHAKHTVFESPSTATTPSGKASWEKQLSTISWQEAVDEAVPPVETPRHGACDAQPAVLSAEVACALCGAADALQKHGKVAVCPLLRTCARVRLYASGSGRNKLDIPHDPLPLARVAVLRNLLKVRGHGSLSSVRVGCTRALTPYSCLSLFSRPYHLCISPSSYRACLATASRTPAQMRLARLTSLQIASWGAWVHFVLATIPTFSWRRSANCCGDTSLDSHISARRHLRRPGSKNYK